MHPGYQEKKDFIEIGLRASDREAGEISISQMGEQEAVRKGSR
jgi:hypothetical protein